MVEKRSIKEELEKTREDLMDLEMYIKEFSTFLPLPVCMVNPVERIIDVNKSFEEITRYKSIEVVGESLKSIFSEDKKTEKILTEVKSKEQVITDELTLVSKEKKEIPVRVSISIRRDESGTFLGYFVSLTDITEIKKFQEKLEEEVKIRTKELEGSRKSLINILEDVEEARKKAEQERDKTLTVINNFTDGLLVFDKQNRLLLSNPQAEDFLKVEDKEIEGKLISELAKKPGIKPLIDLLGGEIKDVFRKEALIGENLVLEVSTVPILSGQEELGNLVVLHDITREKMVERIKTEFVSLAAHQLRTPLSAIKWTLGMFLDGDLGKITKEQTEFLGKSYQANERMISLINELLDITKIEEGRYLYKPVLSDLENVVHFVLDSYQEEIARKKISLDYKKPQAGLPKIALDVEKMRLVIQNLLDNAIKYTFLGGKITVLLEYDKNKEEIKFSIRDSGVGIPQNQRFRVFSKFFRGANVVRMETEGSGLGLFISKNIVEAHNGKIWFESEEGKGTVFYIVLPTGEENKKLLKEF